MTQDYSEYFLGSNYKENIYKVTLKNQNIKAFSRVQKFKFFIRFICIKVTTLKKLRNIAPASFRHVIFLLLEIFDDSLLQIQHFQK
jgi:hypothetical protein